MVGEQCVCNGSRGVFGACFSSRARHSSRESYSRESSSAKQVHHLRGGCIHCGNLDVALSLPFDQHADDLRLGGQRSQCEGKIFDQRTG